MQKMTKLKVLKLSKNKITHLLFGVRDIHNLQILHLQSNNLKALPNGMHQLTRLKELRIENNKIEKFNIQLSLMPNLECISLDWFSYLIP